MNNKLFQIKSFKLHENKIAVEIIKVRKPETITINRKEFEKWLSDSGRLDFIFDFCDYNGQYEQNGDSQQTYWQDYIQKDQDLYDWIVLTYIAEDAFNIQQPLSNILGGYFFTALKNQVC